MACCSLFVAPGDPDQLVTLVIIYLDGLSRLAGQDPERFRQHFPEVQLFLRIFTPLEDSERRHVLPKP